MPADDIARLYSFVTLTTIQSAQVNAELNALITAMNSKAGRGVANTFTGANIFSGANTFSGITTFSEATTGIKTDKVNEYTSANGVSVDSVLHKDGFIRFGTGAGYTPTVNGEVGYDTTSNQFKGYRNGSSKSFLMTGDAASISAVTARSSNTILGSSDNGGLFVFTSTFTQTLTAAATLGSTWAVSLRNDGTGIITLDPNGAETIDGSTTITMYPGEAFMVVCDGTNFKTIGRARGLVLLQTLTASASTTIDFTSYLTSDFDEYEFHIIDLVPATDATDLNCRISQDAGGSWKSAAGDYAYGVGFEGSAASGFAGSASATFMSFVRNTGNASGKSVLAKITLSNPASSTLYKHFHTQSSSTPSGANGENGHGWGIYKTDTNAINGVRFLMSSGNITSGTFRMYGMRK